MNKEQIVRTRTWRGVCREESCRFYCDVCQRTLLLKLKEQDVYVHVFEDDFVTIIHTISAGSKRVPITN